MKITLQVNGREMTFSEEELTAIVEKHFAEEVIEVEPETHQVEQLTSEEWFEVNPLEINQSIFQAKREDKNQEATRQLILQALTVLKKDPQRYGRPFETLIPEKTWLQKTAVELITLASDLGDHNADWIELAFEWAQKICNGASWESICNKPDTAKWFRLVRWKYGVMRIAGGSVLNNEALPESSIGGFNYGSHQMIHSAVPLVVRYK